MFKRKTSILVTHRTISGSDKHRIRIPSPDNAIRWRDSGLNARSTRQACERCRTWTVNRHNHDVRAPIEYLTASNAILEGEASPVIGDERGRAPPSLDDSTTTRTRTGCDQRAAQTREVAEGATSARAGKLWIVEHKITACRGANERLALAPNAGQSSEKKHYGRPQDVDQECCFGGCASGPA
jgi:hypothetical protein